MMGSSQGTCFQLVCIALCRSKQGLACLVSLQSDTAALLNVSWNEVPEENICSAVGAIKNGFIKTRFLYLCTQNIHWVFQLWVLSCCSEGSELCISKITLNPYGCVDVSCWRGKMRSRFV